MANYPRQWHIAYTKALHERKAAERLSNLGIESYVPVQTVPHKWSDRIKLVEHVVIPRLVFLKINSGDYRQVSDFVPNINGYMVDYTVHKYATVSERELFNFRELVARSSEKIYFQTTNLVHGNKAIVTKGPFAGIECEVVRILSKTYVAVRISGLGYTCLNVPMDCLMQIKDKESSALK